MAARQRPGGDSRGREGVGEFVGGDVAMGLRQLRDFAPYRHIATDEVPNTFPPPPPRPPGGRCPPGGIRPRALRPDRKSVV